MPPEPSAPAHVTAIERFPSHTLFKALGDPRRIGILARLATSPRPLTVGEVSACCPTDLSVVSRHLSVLREAGVLEAEKHGREVHYRVRFSELAGLLRDMADAIEACCPSSQSEQACRSRVDHGRGRL